MLFTSSFSSQRIVVGSLLSVTCLVMAKKQPRAGMYRMNGPRLTFFPFSSENNKKAIKFINDQQQGSAHPEGE